LEAIYLATKNKIKNEGEEGYGVQFEGRRKHRNTMERSMIMHYQAPPSINYALFLKIR
jgi:hypothetical protein